MNNELFGNVFWEEGKVGGCDRRATDIPPLIGAGRSAPLGLGFMWAGRSTDVPLLTELVRLRSGMSVAKKNLPLLSEQKQQKIR